jgi:predicted glycosyltransferase
MTRLSVFFYVQHLLGIGHLVRASRIAQALARGGFEVVMACGGVPVKGFPGSGVELMSLPPIKAAPDFAALQDAQGRPVDEALKLERRSLLLSGFDRSRADILLIEAFPFGRRQMRFELMPLIERAHQRRPRPLIACSVRDILQEGRRPERLEESAAIAQRYFDLVLVHGDPKFVRFEESFPLASRIASKIAYTGLVAGLVPEPPSESFDVVASAGGGAAGAELVRCVAAAVALLPGELRWCLLTGPNYPQSDVKSLAESNAVNLTVERFRSDFASLLCTARLSISQAGYNTVCDILRANCPAVLVPFAAGGETEQSLRGKRLEALGLARVLPEQQLSVDSLCEAVRDRLGRRQPASHGLNLEGAEKMREILRRHVARD